MANTTVTWRSVPLLNASGVLTPDGIRLLELELNEERLAVITFVGPPSTRTARNELVIKLLGQTDAAVPSSDDESLILLASVSHRERDFQLLFLDINATNITDPDACSGLEQLIGAVCALSSLVISCYDEINLMSSFVSLLWQFQSLFQTLVDEFVTVEVFEIIPKLLSIDYSPNRSLADKLVEAKNKGQEISASTLANLIKLRDLGFFCPNSIAQMTFDDFVGDFATVKSLFGLEMTGEVLGGLLRKLSLQIDEQRPLDFGIAWDDFVEDKCRAQAEEALSTYVDCVHPAVLEHPPMEFEAFKQLHEDIWRLSLDVYRSTSKFKSIKYRTVRKQLKADIHIQYDHELDSLTQKSREFCESIRHDLWADLYAHATQTPDDRTFAAMLLAIQEFDQQYNEKASGPEKAAVLRSFYKNEAIQAFHQLESVITQQWSEQRLQKLRLQLEKDFDDKKTDLVKHFMHKEAELRSGMARDMETMQKMLEAKVARAKIEESEAKRHRDKLVELKRHNTELQEKLVILEHKQQDALIQNAVLITQVGELEHVVQREIESRTELVETLALTIDKAKKEEFALNERIGELQLELGEKTLRIEGELQDLTQRLRKTNEEKEELQEKLSELMFKVTALPEALQQHLFCVENDGFRIKCHSRPFCCKTHALPAELKETIASVLRKKLQKAQCGGKESRGVVSIVIRCAFRMLHETIFMYYLSHHTF
ncbi:uncharacterized protein PHALS_12414 [Plasmopara halstedii]|uniref:Uncharacterized protein n=1 Tax=Plasmopara halstedii TaxID=4781 RepID=A0A0P1AMC9_PLAHL|nr:uncharacterized protein PHALS_12414 [Plasmopara halstedii]CEG42111.1 hypothetical protein PHALS_12414 [Plasmopara halstedii]|eukprot:XP_024578480.1 hypothetical protein PHALS_12414 [Plasmopara halstedii]